MSPVEARITIGLLALIAVLLGAQMLLQRRRSSTTPKVIAEIDRAIARLGAAMQHHAEVSAVLALAENFKDNPTLLQNLAGYSRQVVAAALLLRVNALGQDIVTAQAHLSAYRKTVASGYSYANENVARGAQLLESLHEELAAAHKAVEAFNRPRAVS